VGVDQVKRVDAELEIERVVSEVQGRVVLRECVIEREKRFVLKWRLQRDLALRRQKLKLK
jgi:activator of HSP90 ATPase